MAILILLSLLQAERRGLSIVVIVLAGLAFIAALALVVYFYKRFKAAEKQTEDDWQSGMHALLGQKAPPTAEYELQADGDIDGIVSKPTPISKAPPVAQPSVTSAARYPEKAPPRPDATVAPVQETAEQREPSKSEAPISVPVKEEPRRPSVDISIGSLSKPKVESQPPPPSQPAAKTPIVSPPTPSQPTQVLGSLRSEAAEPGEPPVDEKPLTGLETVPTPVPTTTEIRLPDSSKTAGLTGLDSTAQVRSARPTSLFDASRTASLEGERGSQPPTGLSDKRIPYEAPSIDPLKSGQVIKREPYERPIVAPLEPRDQPPDKRVPDKAKLDQVISRPVQPRPTREASPPVIASAVPLKPRDSVDFPDAVVAADLLSASAGGARQSRAPHGSVLGIPAVVSSSPIRLGEPVRDSKEAGIGGLVNYGKPPDSGGGRAGLIVLGVLLLAIAIAVLIYAFVPSIHNGVNDWLAKVRGRDAESLAAADNRPRARVLPRSSEADKNIAKAKGSIENISEPPAPLENLEVEVSLVRSVGGATENKRVPVTPSVLEWGQRGQYEFEYDGDRSTGFSGYKIVKLWSGDKEIRFTSPVLSTPAPSAADGSATRR
jgi:hypothetical protein